MKSFKRVCITLIALFCCGIVSADGLQGVGPKEEPVLKGKDKFEQVKEELGKKKDRSEQTKEKPVLRSKNTSERIKEEPVPNNDNISGQTRDAVLNSESRFVETKSYNPRTRGYRGWVETGGAIGLGEYGSGVFSFSTSHGYQFNPYFFLGAGIGVDCHFDWETVFMPIFANARAYFIDGKISPFMDVKIGYSPVDDSGLFYFTPSVGVSFGTSKKCAVNLSIGYNLQRVMMYVYRYVPEYDHYNLLYDSRESLHGLSFKLGFEF